ncbi:hypothetical protein ACOME3_001217 [Neoechinorhynchus agilis]
MMQIFNPNRRKLRCSLSKASSHDSLFFGRKASSRILDLSSSLKGCKPDERAVSPKIALEADPIRSVKSQGFCEMSFINLIENFLRVFTTREEGKARSLVRLMPEPAKDVGKVVCIRDYSQKLTFTKLKF